jgi:hypothetical protein
VVVGNSRSVSIIINRTGATKPITNPTTSGSYTLTVKTSVETSSITSNSYTISNVGPVTNVTVNVNPDGVNAASSDTVNFTAANALGAGSGTVTITFPYNTFIPTSMATSNVRVANGAGSPTNWTNASGVSTNPSARSVTVTVPNAISAGNNVRVAFLIGAAIENPSIDQDYTLTVKTSAQPINATSAAYTIQPTSTTISLNSFNITPQAVSVLGQYNIGFTTGAQGRLISGTSTIGIIFPYPYDISFTLGTPATSKVRVNATSAAAVDLLDNVSTDEDTLIITVPSSVTISNGTGVTVVIDSTAGIQNASSGALLNYKVYTSVERGLVGTDFSLPVELTSFTAESAEGRIYLKWVTESELENAYWMLERKSLTAAEYDQIRRGTISVYDAVEDFEELVRIDGQGSYSAKTVYTYSDSSVQAGSAYAYRLADVSYQGHVTYHEPVLQKVGIPAGFSLSQNYPNPFNPETSIKFTLPVNGLVDLKVYNILGQEVKVLVDGAMKAGFHKVQWDGTNLHNQRVATGIYIYRIQVKSAAGSQLFSKVQKMALLR